MKNKGFTLIELLAVIVILAIIALIATPIILGIINNATLQSKERTSELIGASVVNAYTSYSLKQPSVTVNDFCSYMNPSFFTMDNVEYVSCNDNESKLKSGTDNYTVIYEEGKVYVTLDGTDVKKEVLINPDWDNYPTPTQEDCFTYSDNGDNTVTITKYMCSILTYTWNTTTHLYDVPKYADTQIYDVVIPKTIDGKTVTHIGESAFLQKQINSVVIPPTVTNIGLQAFTYNNLTSVTIPDSVTTIEQNAFYGNKLTSVKIGKNVTIIGLGAFYNNELTNIEIPKSVTLIDGRAFVNNKLTNIVINNFSNLEIGNSAFRVNEGSNPNLLNTLDSDTITQINNINLDAFN